MVTFEDIFSYVLFPIIVFIVQYSITRIFENEDGEKKKSIWINFLRINNVIINECLSKFEKIESTNNKLIEFFKSIIPLLLYVPIVILFFINLLLSGNAIVSMAITNFIGSILILLLSIILYKYTSDKIKEGNLLNKSNKIKNYYSIINWLFLGLISWIIPGSYRTIVNLDKIPESDLIKSRLFYLISIMLILLTIFILLILFRRLFYGILKLEINMLYFLDFPTISINEEILNGKIIYIFDKDLIILDYNGMKKGILWNEINVISIKHNRQ